MPGHHRDFLPIVLGVFTLVAGYGVVNDELIAHIAPTHFDEYYPHYFPFAAPWAQALCVALVATGGPGMAWGIMLYWAGHYGPGPKIGVRATLLGAAMVVFVTAGAAWYLGMQVKATQVPPYPQYFYPGGRDELNISETVQLTN
ncbi:MAG TPA: hypothetical protein VK737_02280, partial [Opitutales bacterium]|nr:hypothetical protein [Opitutales bacterium]